MRNFLIITGMLALASLGSASAQTTADPQPMADTPESDPAWLEKNNNLKGAATAPLDDLNLRRLDIPVILLEAAQTPYALTGLTTCDAIGAEIGRLDEVLGVDLDFPAVADSRTLTEKGEAMAGKQAVSAVKDVATSIIPYRGIVRKVSGAEKHQREVDVALQAGQSRRAFLKGVGMARNCAPPAAPVGFVPKKAAIVKPKAR